MSETQGNDVEIPVIMICDGWSVDDVETLDDCDDAFAYLTGAMVAIETKIEEAEKTGTDYGDRFIRLKQAYRWKKAALQIVQTKRGRIGRGMKAQEARRVERIALDVLRERDPVTADSIIEEAVRRAKLAT